MLTGPIRAQVDQIWNAFWSGGVSNPLSVIEQITYLLFIKRLDDLHTLEENKARTLNRPMERRIFPEGDDPKGIRNALLRTVELVASFGFSGQSLRADSALLPIAYYLFNKTGADNYVTHSRYLADREQVRIWLTRSILKASGIWGSGLDTLLTALREVFKNNQEDRFPVEELGQVMSARGKTLNFEPAEIEDLLHLPYGDRRIFALLAVLFPFVDLKNNFHVDHVFPISRFSKRRLEKLGFTDEEVETLSRQANELPNLQLLDGSANIEKQAELPSTWLEKNFPNEDQRRSYCDRHLLGAVPDDLSGFVDFYAARREMLRHRLVELLTATSQVG